MTKVIHIEYCETNEKYDCFVDGEYRGKYYTLQECLKSLLKREQFEELKCHIPTKKQHPMVITDEEVNKFRDYYEDQY